MTELEEAIIERIAHRYLSVCERVGINEQHTKEDIMLAIGACHEYASPLRLIEMATDDENDLSLVHDVSGILFKLSPETLTFSDCFLPRYSKAA